MCNGKFISHSLSYDQKNSIRTFMGEECVDCFPCINFISGEPYHKIIILATQTAAKSKWFFTRNYDGNTAIRGSFTDFHFSADGKSVELLVTILGNGTNPEAGSPLPNASAVPQVIFAFPPTATLKCDGTSSETASFSKIRYSAQCHSLNPCFH